MLGGILPAEGSSRLRSQGIGVLGQIASAVMIVALLLSVGALATPVTGLIIRPDVRGARHGFEGQVELGRFVWYGYAVVAGLVLAFALIGLARRTYKTAAGAATALLVLMPVFGGIHVLSVATGVFRGDGQPVLAAVSALVAAAAMTALVTARVRLRGSG